MAAQELIRYRTIDRCLKDKTKRWTWKELADACETALLESGQEKTVSRRTIMYDIRNMRSNEKLGYLAPISWNRIEGYRYTRSDYSINNVPLKESDLGKLNQALTILKQYSGKARLTGLEDTITKLAHTLNLQTEVESSPVIQFDHSLYEEGQRWLDTIYTHILKRHCLRIRYQPFDAEEPYWRTISPYLLKEYQNRWYLFALAHDHGQIRNYALDRILQVEESIHAFEQSPDFDPRTYFEDVIGVSVDHGVNKEQIVVRVNPKQAKYIRTNPFHPSLKLIEENNNYSTFSFSVIPNYEMKSMLLQFGDELEVLEPASVRAEMREMLEGALGRYGWSR